MRIFKATSWIARCWTFSWLPERSAPARRPRTFWDLRAGWGAGLVLGLAVFTPAQATAQTAPGALPPPANTPTPAAASGQPASGSAEQAELVGLAGRAERELRGNILPFWLKHARHPQRGGFYGEVRGDLSANETAPRGALLTCRVLWTFSAAYRRYNDAAYLEMARWAYDDLVARFWDEENGGLYWTVTPEGRPLDARKQIYVQVFGIYALSEFHRATKEADALERARALYELVEENGRDHERGGYYEAFARDWKPLGPEVRSVMGSPTVKSQNTMLHVMEAYTNLLRAWPDAGLKKAQGELIDVMLTRVRDASTGHLRLFMDGDWTPRSERISFGHDIEAAWLLTEAADVLGDKDVIARTRKAADEIARLTLKKGVDVDGGLFNEADPRGVTDANKDWWPQAEAAVGFLNAYQLSHDASFLVAAQESWTFIETRLVDKKGGEWFESVTREGMPRPRPKISLWKCCYHNGRACLELMARVEALGAQPR